MDPRAALDIVNSTETEPRAYRADCLVALSDWLRAGGDMPTGGPGEPMHPTLTEAACETMRSEGLFDLACAVRVALAYGEPMS